jgi:hypothetical protein
VLVMTQPWTACVHFPDSYSIDVFHLSFNFLCLMLLCVSISMLSPLFQFSLPGVTLVYLSQCRRPSTAAYTACWAMGTKELKWYTVRKTLFCTGPTRPAKAEQKSLLPAPQAQRTN